MGSRFITSAGAQSKHDPLPQGHSGSQRNQHRLSKQNPLFTFLRGSWLLNFVTRFWKSQQKGNIFTPSRATVMTAVLGRAVGHPPAPSRCSLLLAKLQRLTPSVPLAPSRQLGENQPHGTNMNLTSLLRLSLIFCYSGGFSGR